MSDERTVAPVSPLPSLPGYTLLAERSRDRLGVVYLARQLLYGRDVALRLVPDQAHAGLRDLTGVCRAGRDATRHVHPGLVPLFEISENEGSLYLASDIPPGPSLRERLASGPLTPDAAAALVSSVARALADLHEHHALHLGLTSANVFLDDGGVPCVGDLGLSGLLHNHPGPYPGDPAYAAPEQLAGKKADARADVHALGCLLAECLTGRPISTHPALTGCPPTLARICRKALAARPTARYASAAEMADELDRFRRGEAAGPGPVENLLARIQQIPALPLLVILVLVLIGSAVLAGWWSMRLETEHQRLETAHREAEEWRQKAELHAVEAQRLAADSGQSGRAEVEKVAAARAAAEKKAHQTALDLERQKKATAEEYKRRLEAEGLHRDEAKKRVEAEDQIKANAATLQSALDNRAATAREVDRLLVAHGTALQESGDYTGALVSFVRALSMAHREKLPEDAHRLRIAALLSRCPRPLWTLNVARGANAGVRLSPDGKRVLLVGADGVLAVHDTAGGMLGRQMVHGAAVADAVFSPDSRRLLSADAAGRVRMWNVEDGTLVFDALNLESVPVHICFSGDGKRFAVIRPTLAAVLGAEAQVYNAANGATVGEPITEQVAPLPGDLSPDGSRLLLCSTEGSARLHDVKTGKAVGKALEHGANLTSAVLSSDGRLVLTSGGRLVRVWVAATGERVLPELEHARSDIAPQFDEGGRQILTVGKDGAVRIYETTTGKLAGPPLRLRLAPRQAVLAGDGRSVLLTSADGVVRLFDVVSGRSASPPLMHAAPPVQVALAPTSARALTFAGLVLRVWDLTAGEPSSPLQPEESDAVYSADRKRLARRQKDTVQIHDAAKGSPVGAAMKHKGEVTAVVFSPAGDRVLTVANPPEGATTPTWEVRVWDANTGRAVSEPMEHFREVSLANFGAGGTKVLTVSRDKRTRLWDAKTAERIGKEMEHSEDVLLAEMSPDGRYIITCDRLGMTRAWDANGERVGEGMAHAGRVGPVAFSSDSKLLAICCADGTAGVWEIETGKRLVQMEHAAPVTAAAFSADGSVVLTGCADGSARAWNVEDGKAHTPPLLHEEPVQRVGFSEDGRWLLTAAGRFVRLWDARTGEVIGPPLPHTQREGTIVRQTAFSRTNELITEAGPGTRWTRKLEADSRSEEALADLALVISGREDVGLGQLAPVGSKALETAWERVTSAHGSEFITPRARLVTWSRRGAAECEERGLWGGTLRHLDVLIEDAAEPALFARRGKARSLMGQHGGALADYGMALAKEAGPWEWWAGRGTAAAALGQWARAAGDFAEAVKREARRADLWRQLGQAEAEQGRWKEAAEALAKAVRLSPDEPGLWREQALALLSAGDEKGYREMCSRLVKKFGDRSDTTSRRAVADTCGLAPDAVTDYKRLVEAAEAAVRDKPEDEGEQVRLAVLLLRAGQPARAVTVLEKVVAGGRGGPGELWLLVLVQQRAGQKEQAKEWQSKASAAKHREGAAWLERQTAALWQREAEAVLKGGS
jgi:WD40 repeat protein/tetratricopeptide (TPR) repeat protein